jgi:hypothetical protein
VDAWPLSAPAAGLGLSADLTAAITQVGAAASGKFVLAESLRGSGDPAAVKIVAIGLTESGTKAWQTEIAQPGVRLVIQNTWAGGDGSALLHVAADSPAGLSLPDAEVPKGTMVANENRLYWLSDTGERGLRIAIASYRQPDLMALQQAPNPLADPEAFRRLLESAGPENLRKIVVHESENGFDVLIERSSRDESRDGHHWLRIAPDGTLAREVSLTAAIEERGLQNWADFYVDGNDLLLLGSVNVPSNRPTRRTRIDRASVSRIDLGSREVVSRLSPLDEPYLDAYLNARDEAIQTLANLPVGTPTVIVRLGATPIAISIGWNANRASLRIDESTADLDSLPGPR